MRDMVRLGEFYSKVDKSVKVRTFCRSSNSEVVQIFSFERGTCPQENLGFARKH